MGMLLTCNHCYSVDYHRLDLSSNEVVCLKCGKSVETTRVAKSVLENSKQIVKTVRSENEMMCEACGAVAPPIVKKYSATDYRVVCSVCGAVNQRQTRFFADVWRKKSDVKVIPATPEELNTITEMNFKRAQVQNVVDDSVNRVSEVAPEPLLDDSGQTVESSTDKDISSENKEASEESVEPKDDENEETYPGFMVDQAVSTKVSPNAEARARKRAEALLNTNPVIGARPPVNKNITESDIVVSGLSDFAGPVDD